MMMMKKIHSAFQHSPYTPEALLYLFTVAFLLFVATLILLMSHTGILLDQMMIFLLTIQS